MTIYTIILADGKTFDIKANAIEFEEKTGYAVFYYDQTHLTRNKQEVARINTNNIVGWIDSKYLAESEEESEED